jgi:hypothetical protein
MRPSRFFLLPLVLVALLVPAAAHAADYDVHLCDPTAPSGDFVFDQGPGTVGLSSANGCGTSSAPAIVLSGFDTGSPIKGRVGWSVTPPPPLTLHALSFDLAATGAWNARLSAAVFELTGQIDGELQILADRTTPPLTGHHAYTFADAKRTSSTLECNEHVEGTCGAEADSLSYRNINVTVDDPAAPVVTPLPGGTLLAGRPLSGGAGVGVTATDVGSGVSRLAVYVDGTDAKDVIVDNAGACVEPYRKLQPCPGLVSTGFTVDTTALTDGPHQVQLVAEDGAHNVTKTAPTTVTVHNAADLTRRPALTGTAHIGGTLTTDDGTWTTHGTTTYARQWLRCPATATDGASTGCTPIAGATNAAYVVTKADVGHRLASRVTATTALATATATSLASGTVAAPVPSNAFRVLHTSVHHSGSLTLTVSLPGAGRFTAAATSRLSKHRTLSYGRRTVTTRRAGTVSVAVKPGSKALAALRHARKLKLTVALAFTPTGGTARKATRTVTVRAPKHPRR